MALTHEKAVELFNRFDVNKNGTLSLAEVDKALGELMPELSTNKAAMLRAFKAADTSKNGLLDVTEFKYLFNLLQYYNSLGKMFASLDKDGDHRLSIQEYVAAHGHLGIPMNEEQAKQEFARVDENHGGFILFQEFCMAMAKKQAGPPPGAAASPSATSRAVPPTASASPGPSGSLAFAPAPAPKGSAWAALQLAPVVPLAPQKTDELFKQFDVNKNNILSLAEVDKALAERLPDLFKNKSAMMRAYKAADTSGNGFLNKHEFSYLLSLLYQYNQIGNSFAKIDVNKDHRLSEAEFVAGCKAAGVSTDDAHLKAEFTRVDTNHGGFVLFDEFCFYVLDKKIPAPAPSAPAAPVTMPTVAAAPVAPVNPTVDSTQAWASLKLPPVVPLPSAKTDELFLRFDVNKNNVLSLAEVDKALGELFPDLYKNKAAMMRAFKAADTSGNGWLNKHEFSYLLSLLYQYNQLGSAFAKVDVNKDHRISEAEFVAGCKAAGVHTDDTHLKAEFAHVDVNHGGFVLFDEFCFYILHKKLPTPVTSAPTPSATASENQAASTTPTSISAVSPAAAVEVAAPAPTSAPSAVPMVVPATAAPTAASVAPAAAPVAPTASASPAAPAETATRALPPEEGASKAASPAPAAPPKAAVTKAPKPSPPAAKPAAKGKLAPKAAATSRSPAVKSPAVKTPAKTAARSPSKPAASPQKKPASPLKKAAATSSPASAEAHAPLDEETKKKVDECYDRLTNPKNFHGIYKERFKEKGLIEGESANESGHSPSHQAPLDADTKHKVDECYDRLTNPKNFHGMYKERFKEKGLIKESPEKSATGPHKAAPLDANTKKKVDECYDRLTNPKNFHGMYKERFKEKGLIEGETSTTTAKAAAHHAPADPDTKKKVDECYDRLTNPKNFHGMYKERFKEKGLIEGEAHASEHAKSPVAHGAPDAETKKKVDECYDRLTNPKNFHGMYKERFKEKGLLDPAAGKSPAKTSPAKSAAKPAPAKSPAKSPTAKGKPAAKSPAKPAASAAKGSPTPKPVPRTAPAASSPAPAAAAPAANGHSSSWAALKPVAPLPTPQIDALWKQFDVNQNGAVSLAELDRGIQATMPEFYKNKNAMKRAFKAADMSGNGLLDKHEFGYLLSLLHQYNEIANVFAKLDTNNDRRLSEEEFLAGCKAAGVAVDDAHLKAEFGRMDANGGGFVLFDEFCFYVLENRIPPPSNGATPAPAQTPAAAGGAEGELISF